MDIKYIIGVDGGGTKTETIVLDNRGIILGHSIAGPSNINIIGFNQAVKSIINSIRKSMDMSGIKKADIAILGLAGAGRKRIAKRFYRKLIKNCFLKNLKIFSDGYIALIAATRYSKGIMINSGTGIIVMGIDDKGKIERCSGWGYLIDDEGSGYWIGQKILNRVFRSFDGRDRPTALLKVVLNVFDAKDLDEVLIKVYSDKNFINRITSITKYVGDLWINDSIAREILEEAAEEMAIAISCVQKKLNIDCPDIYYLGGVFDIGKPLVDMLERKLKKYIAKFRLLKPMFKNVIGAGLIGLREIGINIDNYIICNIYDSGLKWGLIYE